MRDASLLCGGCGAEVAPGLLTCPACRRLVHADELARLAGEAETHEREGRAPEAVAAWREALALLPPNAAQSDAIRARVTAATAATGPSPSPVPAWLAPLGVIGVALWKFKFLVALALTKGKLLLVGLTHSGTLLSMLAAMGVYWTLWGWRFALGFVLLIYVHEMGHVAALRRLGIAATAPMFLPGIGAVVRLRQYPATAREDARVGLAGPVWGVAAALAAYAIAAATGSGLFIALAHAGALINLFNLIPVWQLDGARGMRALGRRARLGLALGTTSAFLVTSEGTLLLLSLATWVKAFQADAPDDSDGRALVEFAGLVLATLLLGQVPVPDIQG